MAGFDLKTLMYRLDALTVFRGLLQDPVVAGLADCLHASATEGDGSDKADRTICAYATFISRLYEAGYVSIGAYLTDEIGRASCRERV